MRTFRFTGFHGGFSGFMGIFEDYVVSLVVYGGFSGFRRVFAVYEGYLGSTEDSEVLWGFLSFMWVTCGLSGFMGIF